MDAVSNRGITTVPVNVCALLQRSFTPIFIFQTTVFIADHSWARPEIDSHKNKTSVASRT